MHKMTAMTTATTTQIVSPSGTVGRHGPFPPPPCVETLPLPKWHWLLREDTSLPLDNDRESNFSSNVYKNILIYQPLLIYNLWLYPKPLNTIHLIGDHFFVAINLLINWKLIVLQLHCSVSNIDKSTIFGHSSKYCLKISCQNILTFNIFSHSHHIWKYRKCLTLTLFVVLSSKS